MQIKLGDGCCNKGADVKLIGGEHDWKCLCKEPEPEFRGFPKPNLLGGTYCKKCNKKIV